MGNLNNTCKWLGKTPVDDIAKFKKGSSGLIRIDLDVLKAEGVHVFDHEFILPLIKGNVSDKLFKSFINSREVLIKGKIPFKAIELIK